jgi:hypothetical protein
MDRKLHARSQCDAAESVLNQINQYPTFSAVWMYSQVIALDGARVSTARLKTRAMNTSSRLSIFALRGAAMRDRKWAADQIERNLADPACKFSEDMKGLLGQFGNSEQRRNYLEQALRDGTSVDDFLHAVNPPATNFVAAAAKVLQQQSGP